MTPTEKVLAVEIVVALILLGTGIATGLAAKATKESAKATEDNTRAELLVRLSQQFWSREFGEACDQLGEFADRNDFAEIFSRWRGHRHPWTDQQQAWVPQYDRLNAARRRIKGYYHSVYQLHRGGHFTREEIRDLLTSEANTQLLLSGVEPLETIVSEGYDPEEGGDLYQFYHDLYDRKLSRPLVDDG